MALLERCFCCSLSVASVVLSVYTLIAYSLAFMIGFYWVVQKAEELPITIYALYGIYIVVIISTGFLIRGLASMESKYLVTWLILVGLASIPEAYLIIDSSMNYWLPATRSSTINNVCSSFNDPLQRKIGCLGISSLYGLLDLTFWACRFSVLIAGFIAIQSLYSAWRRDMYLVRSLHSMIKKPDLPNGFLPNQLVDHRIQPVPSIHEEIEIAPSPPRVQRSSSALAQYPSVAIQMVSQQSLPNSISSNLSCDAHSSGSYLTDPSTTSNELMSPNEFNARNFDSLIANALHNPYLFNISVSRTHSMLNMDPAIVSNFSQTPLFSGPLNSYSSTQSLDRRSRSTYALSDSASNDYQMRRACTIRNLGSVNEREMMRFPSPVRGYTGMNTFPSRLNNSRCYSVTPIVSSRVSFTNESDDFHRYKDVAL